VGWALIIGLALAIRWPVGVLRHLSKSERIAMLLGILASVLSISTLKQLNHTSCPWDLAEFGGMANYVSHWVLTVRDGGPGQCFPGGHASTGFALFAGYFALHKKAPRAAHAWLVAALVAGFGLGWVQQIRGAHYFSHNLWTAWICWTVSGTLDAAWRLVAAQRQARLARLAVSPS
jgi:membrane-associated PAP2 superfamily phosphatase